MSCEVLVYGMGGHMGREVAALALGGYRGVSLACGVDVNGYDGNAVCHASLNEVTEKCDCIIDFSHHSATAPLLDYAVRKGLPVVLCTTGHTEEEKQIIQTAASKIPVFLSANMSVGVALLVELAKKDCRGFPRRGNRDRRIPSRPQAGRSQRNCIADRASPASGSSKG
ncbi:MAG: hypothetical protein J6B54_03850 [Clostridia bacterium]|nr:hypothetical protein [Clostridia bacterium]